MFNLKYSLAKNLVKRKISKKKIDDLLIFLQRYITGYNVKFDKEIGALNGNQKSMGIREMVLDKAKKEGIQENKSEIVKTLLIMGEFSISKIAEIVNVSEAFVERIKSTLK